MRKLPVVLLATGASFGVLIGSLAAQDSSRGNPPNALVHKGWMDEAGDAQDELGEALSEKDGAVVSEAALKIEALMAKTEAYWAAKRAADIVKLAQAARALSKEVAAAGAANRIVLAQGAFEKLNANCNACHDLHPEKR